MNPLTNRMFIVSSNEPQPASASANPRCMPGGYVDCISGVTADGKCERSCSQGPGPGGVHSTVTSVMSTLQLLVAHGVQTAVGVRAPAERYSRRGLLGRQRYRSPSAISATPTT